MFVGWEGRGKRKMAALDECWFPKARARGGSEVEKVGAKGDGFVFPQIQVLSIHLIGPTFLPMYLPCSGPRSTDLLGSPREPRTATQLWFFILRSEGKSWTS